MADEKDMNLKFSVDDQELKDLREDVNDLSEDITDLKDDIKDLGDSSEKGFKKLGTTLKNSKIGKGINDIGSAIGSTIKAFGPVAIIIGLVAKLSEMLMANQTVTDLVAKVMGTLQIVMNAIVDTVVKVIDNVKNMSGGMDATKAIISDLIKIALTPLKLQIDAITFAAKYVALAWEKGPFGKKDEGRIKELTQDISDLKDSMKETYVEAGAAFVDIGKNAGTAFNEIKNVAKVVTDTVKKSYKEFNLETAKALAKTAAEAKKIYGIIAADAEKLIIILEGEAETYRMVRDDANKSFVDRKKASEDLLETYKKQEKAALQLAQAHVDELKAQYNLTKSTEDYIAMEVAKTQITQVQVDYAMKRMEVTQSQTNANLEEADSIFMLEQAQASADGEILKNQASIILGFKERIEKTREALRVDFETNKQILENRLKTQTEGTAAYNETQAQLIEIKKGYAIEIMNIDKEVSDHNIELANAERDAKIQIAKESVQTLKDIDSEATQTAINLLDRRLQSGEVSQKEYDKAIAEIEEKAAKRQKAYAIAGVIVDAASAIMNIWAKVADPTPIAAFKIAQTAMVGGLAVAQIAAISSSKVNSSVPSVGGGSDHNTAPTTSFTFAEPPATKQEAPIVKTYVVAKDVQTQNQLDRQIVNNGSI